MSARRADSRTKISVLKHHPTGISVLGCLLALSRPIGVIRKVDQDSQIELG